MRYMLAVIKSVPEKVTWFPVHSIIVRWNSIWCMDKESALMHKNFVEVLSRPFACVTITRSVRHHVLAVFIGPFGRHPARSCRVSVGASSLIKMKIRCSHRVRFANKQSNQAFFS